MKKGIRLLSLLLTFVLLWGCGNRLPVNWTPTFESEHTIPFGTYILYKELPEIFPDKEIKDVKKRTSDFIEDRMYEDGILIQIGQENLRNSKDDLWNEVLDFVNYGGSALISMESFSYEIRNELGVDTGIHSEFGEFQFLIQTDKKSRAYTFEDRISNSYFSVFDKEKTTVLGQIKSDKDRPNFIRVEYGDGYFLLHTAPLAFTNYHMLEKEHYKYVLDVLSYVQADEIYWDNRRILQREALADNSNGGFFNSLGFILKHEPLRWAFFILLGTGLLYLIFNSKRRQRVTQVILPYPNYSMEFSKTLADLYRSNPDHAALTKYKINYFLEQLREKYNITAKDIMGDFSELLSKKSEVNPQLCRKLVNEISVLRKRNRLNKEDFLKLQSLIEDFNKKSKKYGGSGKRP